MSDVSIPLELLTGIGVAVVGTVGALWAKIASVERTRDGWIKAAFDAKEAEQENSRALRRAADALERRAGHPSSIPPADEEEKTEVRRALDARSRKLIERYLRDQDEVTPTSIESPRPKMPSRHER
jgi:hypothetical protein